MKLRVQHRLCVFRSVKVLDKESSFIDPYHLHRSSVMAADGAHVALLPMKPSPGSHRPSRSSPTRSNLSSPSQQNLSPSRKAIMEKFSHIQMSASPDKAPLGVSRRINGDSGTTPFQRALLKSSQKTSTQDSPRRQQQSPPARLRDLNRPLRVAQTGE